MTFSPLDSSLLGPLFTTPEMAAVFSDRSKIAAMLACEAALARVQGKLGLVPVGLAPAIAVIAPEMLDFEAIGRQTALAGVVTIPFLRAVQQHLPVTLEAHLHKGATTQDIVDTALVLNMRQAFALVRADLKVLIEALTQMAQAYRTIPCVGRTYGQHAAPITFGYKVAVWCAGIVDVAAQLDALEQRCLTASLSGPVGTLSAMGALSLQVSQEFARELELNVPPIAWHSLRGRMLEAGNWLAMLIGSIGKMATDIVFLTATEVGEVYEPHVPGRGGSSAMPHKRNPVGATLILAAASAAKGHVVTLLDAMLAAHERPAGTWHAEWHALPQLFGLVSGALREARWLALALVVDEGRMRLNIEATRGLLFADAAATVLASSMGRAAAHQCVEQAADKVRSSTLTLAQALAADGDVQRLDLVDQLARAFDLTASTNSAAAWADSAAADAVRVLTKL